MVGGITLIVNFGPWNGPRLPDKSEGFYERLFIKPQVIQEANETYIRIMMTTVEIKTMVRIRFSSFLFFASSFLFLADFAIVLYFIGQLSACPFCVINTIRPDDRIRPKNY